MPDITHLLKTHARERGIRLDIIEKDYALSYLLAAIAEMPGLGDEIALKGGTALRKLYYPGHRFSEDLDYSTLIPGPILNIEQKVAEAIQGMREMLYQRGPFQVEFEPLSLREPHPGGQVAYLVRLQFPAQRQPLCRLKVEIAIDEPVLLPAIARPILHDFDEPMQARVPAYALAEIVAEKLRALLQSREHLTRRGWGASRVCRDYYDLWQILRREGRLDGSIPDLVQRKCAARHVAFEAPESLVNEDLFNVACAEWEAQLQPFVPNAPPAEQVLAEARPLVLALWE